MLNKVILSGRITHDLEVKQTPNGNTVLNFNIAVDRSFVKQGEERQADFINCVAWGKTADFIGRFFYKGRSIAIIGNLRTRTYDDKNGTKHYVTEVYVDEAQFTFEPKPQNGGYQQMPVQQPGPAPVQQQPVQMGGRPQANVAPQTEERSQKSAKPWFMFGKDGQ